MEAAGLGRPAPGGHREVQAPEGNSGGRAQFSCSKNSDGAFARKRRAGRVPDAVRVDDVPVHPEVVTQRMADNPLGHPFAHPGIDHPAQGLGQGGVAHDPLDPRPEAEDRLHAGVGRKVLQGRGGGIDDVVHIFGGGLGHHAGSKSCLGQRLRQFVGVVRPEGGSSEKYGWHRQAFGGGRGAAQSAQGQLGLSRCRFVKRGGTSCPRGQSPAVTTAFTASARIPVL